MSTVRATRTKSGFTITVWRPEADETKHIYIRVTEEEAWNLFKQLSKHFEKRKPK